MVSSCRIGPLPSSSNCSIHTVSSWHFHSSLLQCFPPLLQFQLQHAFLPCAQHHIIREHHLPRCFFSDVFRQWIHHDGKQERAESGSSVEANFRCKGFTCSCGTPHYSLTQMVHFLHQYNVLLWHPLSIMLAMNFDAAALIGVHSLNGHI